MRARHPSPRPATIRGAAALGVTALLVAGCGGTDSAAPQPTDPGASASTSTPGASVSAESPSASASSSSGSASPTRSGSASASHSPRASTTPKVPSITSVEQWCAGYSAITERLASLGQNPTDARTGLTVMSEFDTLWQAAGKLDLLTSEQVKANRQAVVAYSKVMQVVADGGSAEELQAATDALEKVSTSLAGPLVKSSSRVSVACASAMPSASAS